ncbi:hypothetical protein [Hymenobacter yonginensis]|uniref:DUF4890 domain-containing protein n=1 Tax=Hymenobacter yonginensis TaxID=748197 RepID=A0ABY7PPD0_9BACT|nr:hypothetical protein [Hymenobacter yonginensis]WBO84601.1 hypothetical protein O9Z63_19825 [Hymenobacter yonginensis]
MKKLIATSLLASAALLSKPAAAQAPRSVIAPDAPGRQPNEQVQRKGKRKASDTDIANMQRRMNMNPDDAKRDQQVELLEARAGGGSANTSFGRASGPARQYEKGAGGFTVRKFKAGKHTRNAMMKKGQGRPAPGIDPKGKPLTHKKKKKFLFF